MARPKLIWFTIFLEDVACHHGVLPGWYWVGLGWVGLVLGWVGIAGLVLLGWQTDLT